MCSVALVVNSEGRLHHQMAFELLLLRNIYKVCYSFVLEWGWGWENDVFYWWLIHLNNNGFLKYRQGIIFIIQLGVEFWYIFCMTSCIGVFFHAESNFGWYQPEKWVKTIQNGKKSKMASKMPPSWILSSFFGLVPPKNRFSMKKYPNLQSFTKYIWNLQPQSKIDILNIFSLSKYQGNYI